MPQIVIGDYDATAMLDTTRRVLRNLACRINGETYYAQLVKSGAFLDSGIKIRCHGLDYALAIGDYDPRTYDATGFTYWDVYGSPTCPLDYTAGNIVLNGSSYIYHPGSFALKASDSFTFTTIVEPTTVNSATHTIFELYKSSTNRVTLSLGAANKFVVGFNNASSAIITCPDTVTKDMPYDLRLKYMGGDISLYVNGAEAGSASKSITAGDYTPYIGYSKAKSYYFYGKVYQPKLTGAAEFFLPFGAN